MSISIVRREGKTLLQEIQLPSGPQRFPVRQLLTCSLCRQPSPILYSDEQTPGGACLQCKLDQSYLAYLDERDASDAESCCACGCD